MIPRTLSWRRPARTLASLTLTGNSEQLIGDALASARDWVDACIVIDTGVTDRSLELARSIAGRKYIGSGFPWIDDFAAARNFALELARRCGFAWAVMLDTDERIDLRGQDICPLLRQTGADVLLVEDASGAYAKERFFRLPVRGRYIGPTHECYVMDAGRREQLAGPRFVEIAKSAEEYLRKFARDAHILERYTAEHPDDPRWFYYLGDSLQNLQRYPEAIAAYSSCASLPGWDEQAAWARYRAAECWLKLGDPERAVQSCTLGLARHAGIAELPWLAAYASWTAGNFHQAIAWARLSAAAGNFRGAGRGVPRYGFRTPHALYEGPYDVLRFALRAIGDEAGADEADQLYQAAAAMRVAAQG
jgi:tetratricopeptide (TPR) repeat protein